MSIGEAFERVRARMHRRASSYRALFLNADKDLGQAADVVMRDLARYCRSNTTSLQYSRITGMADPIATAFAEGRRDVYNHILGQLRLTNERIEQIATETRPQDE